MRKKISIGMLLCCLMISFICYAPQKKEDVIYATSTTDKIKEAKKQKDALKQKMEESKKKAESLKQEQDHIQGELAWLNTRSEEQKILVAERIRIRDAALEKMEIALNAYLAAQEKQHGKEDEYKDRLTAMYNFRHKSLFELFLEADSLQGFFTTQKLMGIIATTDEQIIEELQAAKDDANLKRETAETTATEMKEIVQQVEAELEQIKSDQNAKAADFDKVADQIHATHEELDSLEGESESLEKEIKDLIKKAEAEAIASGSSAFISVDGWNWPVPSTRNITSGFGQRWGRLHAGIDIAADYGTKIVAAKAGQVIRVSTPVQGQNTGGGGYGNHVDVYHGDGVMTRYAHLRRTDLSDGRTLAAGEYIGEMGSTGNSSGSHLHFEIRINNNPVNPVGYVN